ncbi:MAG TPA: guanylate kinase [Candidatus Fimousia stercorigallinarum]|nr:guanylate kinase [Candidatus Fimousia stercorigallinarum]
MEKRGSLIVISGFSGAGKGTVAKRLVKDYGYSLSVSATTREPREGEVDGVDYYFKSEADFKNLIDYNGFIEYARYVDNYYGTPRAFVENELGSGHNVILEIEVQGALNIKRQYPDAVLIFITAPSVDALKNRLVGRGTEDASVVAKRMKRASEEAEEMINYEYIVVNDDLDDCVHTVHSIVVSKRCELQQNIDFIEETKEGFKQI